MSKITNVTELRESALSVYSDLRSGKINVSQATALTKAISKACATIKLQHDYAHLRKEKPSISFMGGRS